MILLIPKCHGLYVIFSFFNFCTKLNTNSNQMWNIADTDPIPFRNWNCLNYAIKSKKKVWWLTRIKSVIRHTRLGLGCNWRFASSYVRHCGILWYEVAFSVQLKIFRETTKHVYLVTKSHMSEDFVVQLTKLVCWGNLFQNEHKYFERFFLWFVFIAVW